MNKIWSKWLSLGLTLTSFSSFADTILIDPDLQDFNDRLSRLETQRTVTLSASPRAENGVNLFTFGNVLFWQAHEGSIPIAIETTNPLTTDIPPAPLSVLQHGRVKNIEFKWDVGSRIGIGYDWPRDKMDLSLAWLRFFTNSHRALHADTEEQLYPSQLHPLDGNNNLGPQGFTPTPSFSNASAHWYGHLNQLDLDLGRAFYVGRWFKLRPHFGIRTTWIQQKLSVSYRENLALNLFSLPGDDYSVRRKSRWWGIGPEGGLDMSLGLGEGFSLCCDVAGAIEYGFHALKRREVDTTVANTGLNGTLVDVGDNFRVSRPIFDLQLGWRWEKKLAQDRCHLTLEMGWEQHVYYSQHQALYFVDDIEIGSFITHHGDLTFQGWNIAARLDF